MNLAVLEVWARGFAVLLQTLEVIEKICRRLPFYERARDAALDTILGPAEPFDYVSTTTPRTPCPPYER